MGGQSSSKLLVPPEPKWEQEEAAAKKESEAGDETNNSSSDLVFETWITCRHKPNMPKTSWKGQQQRKDNVIYRRDEQLEDSKSIWLDLDCGDDSFFVSRDRTMMGIADGVGGWRDAGVDPSLFANAFMGNSKLYADTHPKEKNVETVMTHAYEKVFTDKVVAAGSSTACGVSISQAGEKSSPGGGAMLNLYNLGDSGAMVLRRGAGILHKTEELTHRFNFPYQLSIQSGLPPPSTWAKLGLNDGQLDRVDQGTSESIEIQRGDVVVLGTDGLFDNRFKSDIAQGLTDLTIQPERQVTGFLGSFSSYAPPSPDVGHSGGQEYVQKELAAAWSSSISKRSATPWADALTEETGNLEAGGKTDDITIVVGRVVRRNELTEFSSSSSTSGLEKK